MIHAVGLHWERDNVFWGAGSKRGALFGVPTRNVTHAPIDFRNQIGLYALYSDFELVYFGQAGSGKQTLFKRLKTHGRRGFTGRWNRFSWFGMLWVTKNGKLSSPTVKFHPRRREALDYMEAIVIEAADPSLNSQSGRFGSDTVFYKQVRDERLGPNREDMIRRLYDAMGA